jgi:hypothetical protein
MRALCPVWLLTAALTATPRLTADEPVAAPPPKDAVIVFDGKDLSAWVNDRGQPAEWKVQDGYFEVVAGKGDVRTKEKFGDFKLHLEFWVPFMADKTGQGRGNSGVYLQGRHEIQVLDSHNNETYANGSCGALYGLIAPSKNASKPPEQWQTYDIDYTAPVVEDGQVKKKGRVTVVHNGVTVIDDGEFDKQIDLGKDKNMGTPGPLLLQDHGCKVRFRNIWLVPKK